PHRGRPTPSSGADQLIERGMQRWRVRGLDERQLGEHAEPNDGLRPRRGVVWAATSRAPENRPRDIRRFARKGVVDAYESVCDESLDESSVDHWQRKFFASSVLPLPV